MKSSRLSRLAQALLPSLIFFSKAGCFCACKATQILSWSNLPRQIRKCPVFQAFSLQAHSCTGECNKTGKLNSSEKRYENSFQILLPPLSFELCAKLNQHSMEFGAEIICRFTNKNRTQRLGVGISPFSPPSYASVDWIVPPRPPFLYLFDYSGVCSSVCYTVSITAMTQFQIWDM